MTTLLYFFTCILYFYSTLRRILLSPHPILSILFLYSFLLVWTHGFLLIKKDNVFSLFVCFQATPTSDQNLLLALCLGFLPGDLGRSFGVGVLVFVPGLIICKAKALPNVLLLWPKLHLPFLLNIFYLKFLIFESLKWERVGRSQRNCVISPWVPKLESNQSASYSSLDTNGSEFHLVLLLDKRQQWPLLMLFLKFVYV